MLASFKRDDWGFVMCAAISFWVNVIANKEHKALMSIAPARNPGKDSISAQWNGKHRLSDHRTTSKQGTSDHWTDNINNSIVNTLSDSTCDNILHTLPHIVSICCPLSFRQDCGTVSFIGCQDRRKAASFFFYYKRLYSAGVAGLRANRNNNFIDSHRVMCDLKSDCSRLGSWRKD